MPTLRRDSGFTLLEMIVSIVLIGILAAVGSTMIADSFTTTRIVNAGSASQGEARYVLERLAREIREVKYIGNSGSGNYCIDTMTQSRFVFDKRTDSSSLDRIACGTATNKVTINYSAPNLTLQIAPASSGATLTSQVATNGFAFSYLKSDGTAAATTNVDVYFVVIALTVKDASSQQSTAQRVRVALRNY